MVTGVGVAGWVGGGRVAAVWVWVGFVGVGELICLSDALMKRTPQTSMKGRRP